MATHNFFKTYSIGSTFPNENGEIYTVIGMNEADDKALLYRKTELGTDYYVGARFPRLNCWGQGHYFMEDYKSAMKWLIGEEEPETPPTPPMTVSMLFDKIDTDDITVYFVDKSVDDKETKLYDNLLFVPVELLEAHVQDVHIDGEIIDDEFVHPYMVIGLASTLDPKIREFFDYGITNKNRII